MASKTVGSIATSPPNLDELQKVTKTFQQFD